MIIVGIDPGINGSAAALSLADSGCPEYVTDAIDLPTLEDGTKRQIDDFELARWLRLINPNAVVIENVQPMPSIPGVGGERRSMGSASSFRFGLAVGQIRATVRGIGIEPRFVHPQVWKRHFDLKGADKEGSRQLALTLWPMSAYLMKRKKDHQRAEAMLLAKWGERNTL